MAWLTGWTYRKKLTVDATNVDGDLVDFPLYVKITSDASIGANALSSGADLRFTSSDGETLLKYERESFSVVSGLCNANLWIKVPSIDSDDGAILYCYYGKTDAADGADPTNVWDSYYKGVWHLPNGTDLTVLDSTANDKDGSITGTIAATTDAQVYGGGNFDGSSGFILTNALSTAALTQHTVSAWIKPDGAQTTAAAVAADMYGTGVNYALFFEEGSSTLRLYGGFHVGGTWCKTGSSTLSAGVRVYATYTYENPTLKLFIDGTSVSSVANSNVPITNSIGFRIGRRWDTGNYFDGCIDEVRVSSIARSAAWIKFEYNNLSQADQELTWGGQEVIIIPSLFQLLVATQTPSTSTGTSVTVLPDTGLLSITTTTPTVTYDFVVFPSALELLVTQLTAIADASVSITVSPDAGLLLATITTPTYAYDFTITPDALSLLLAAHLSTVGIDADVTISTALTLAIGLLDSSISTSTEITVDVSTQTLVVHPQIPTITADYLVALAAALNMTCAILSPSVIEGVPRTYLVCSSVDPGVLDVYIRGVLVARFTGA